MTPELSAVLTELATKLNVSVDVLWAALLKQAPITGSIRLGLLLSAVAGLTILARRIHRTTFEDGDALSPKEARIGAWVGWSIPAAIIFIAIFDFGPNLVAALLNPEYWALAQLLGSRR